MVKKFEEIWNTQKLFFLAKHTELDCVYLRATEATRRSRRAESGSYKTEEIWNTQRGAMKKKEDI